MSQKICSLAYDDATVMVEDQSVHFDEYHTELQVIIKQNALTEEITQIEGCIFVSF
ncbi:MAG: hypothetical protein Tsb0021_10010 [Chlamydiales bacterium]